MKWVPDRKERKSMKRVELLGVAFMMRRPFSCGLYLY